MSRFAERRLAAVVTAIALAQSACYKPATISLKRTSLTLSAGPPVRVASRLDVTIEGQTLVATETPICAPAKVGDYAIINESRRVAETSRKYATLVMVLGAAQMIGGYYLRDTPLVVLGDVLLVLGGIEFGFGVVNFALPRQRTRTLAPELHHAVAVDTKLEVCGEPTPVSIPLQIAVPTGNGDSIGLNGTTTADGRFQLPRELNAFASACDRDVTIGVWPGEGEAIKLDELYSWRASQANLDDKGDEHTVASIRKRTPGLVDTTHLELGANAGKLDPRRYQGASWWLHVETTASEPSGNSELAQMARACRARDKADADNRAAEARRQCRDPKRPAIQAQCMKSCTDTKKQSKCTVAREICDEQTAGIGGSLADQCRQQEQTCLSGVGQDRGSIDTCAASCTDRELTAQCH